MRVIVGDLWEHMGWKIVPVNLDVNKAGNAIMGRGVAAQAAERFPQLKANYGTWLNNTHTAANRERPVLFEREKLILFPVKYRWKEQANVQLIERNLTELRNGVIHASVFLPLIGCGFGEIDTYVVLELLARYLDDKFVLVLRDEAATELHRHTLRPGARVDHTTDPYQYVTAVNENSRKLRLVGGL